MSGWLDRLWYGHQRPLWLLWPLAWLYRSIAARRRAKGQAGGHQRLAAPVIVVGNITAGGTGKSPLTAWLVAALRAEGWQPVILSRGYGGKGASCPMLVTDDAAAKTVGDEPLMLKLATGCPVVVDPCRPRGGRWALEQGLGNILVCDDGLQHYALARDIELAVFDGARGFGNGAPIPVGPLREPVSRLDSVDFVVVNGEPGQGIEHPSRFTMTLEPSTLRHLRSGVSRPVGWLAGKQVRAVAGIGNPSRFFAALEALGAHVRPSALADHHHFTAADLEVSPGEVLVMTAKDAVKCRAIAHDACWVLEVQARLPDSFRQALLGKLNTVNLQPTPRPKVQGIKPTR